MGKLGFYFNSDACIGCHTCVIACKDRNDLPVGLNFRMVETYSVGSYPEVRCYHTSVACNHCEEPQCVAVCPTGAMYVSGDSTVQHDDERCIGCRSCAMACPYGEPQFLESLGVVRKCDSCKPFRDSGKNPVCVDACLMRCLEFGDMDELMQRHGSDLVRELPVLPSADWTKPSLLIEPKPYAVDVEAKQVVI